MPKLVRLYITQAFIGFAVSAAFVAALLCVNTANLWHLVTHDDAGLIAVFILWFANGIVFSGVQFAIAIMRMAGRDDGDQGGTREVTPMAVLDPIPVKIGERR